MSEHDNMNSLEDLFRRKAQEYDIPFSEDDWDALEQRLDTGNLQRVTRIRRRWIAAASIFIISLLGYFTYQNSLEIDRLTQQLTEDSVPRTEEPLIPSGELTGNDQQQNPAVSGDDPGAVLAANPDPSDDPEDPVSSSPPPSSDVSATARGTGDNTSATSGAGGRALLITDIACEGCTFSLISDNPIPSSRQEAIFSQYAITEEKHTDGDSIPIEAGDLITAQQTPPRASLGLALSPDLSTAGAISHFQKPGYKIGITAEYNLNEKFALVTGITQSEVYYSASAANYNPPTDFYGGGAIPAETFAECIILDIPISLKYNFKDFGSSRLFATAGVTSYIMLSEKYRFSYYSNDPSLQTEWEGKTGSTHWLSNAGISLGYELDVHPAWSIRAEPFLKIPVREIGWGNVKLYSLGTFVSLNYRLGN